MAIQWDLRALRARAMNPERRILHEAGSPNGAELDLYREFLITALPDPILPLNRHVVILGMTPGLRLLSHRLGCEVTCVDNNPMVVEYYRDWIPPEFSARERVLEVDWMDMASHIGGPVDVVMGDGVFGNVLSIQGHKDLLGIIRDMVSENSVVLFRKILIPGSFSFDDYEADRLIEDFRAGRLSEAEFGFAMRLWGSFKSTYDPETCLLDNKPVFARYQSWRDRDVLTADEYAVIERYYFGGRNLIPPVDLWESLLTESGFEFERGSLTGHAWYAYYPIYRCRLMKSDGSARSAAQPNRKTGR